jgi:hypothetical protein
MNYDSHAEYYRESRGYNWHDMMEMRRQPRRPSTSVPECWQDRFSSPEEYDAWMEEQRKLYFG